jgi:hypothetical protein
MRWQLENSSASFETAATRLPQDDVVLYAIKKAVMVRSGAQRCVSNHA